MLPMLYDRSLQKVNPQVLLVHQWENNLGNMRGLQRLSKAAGDSAGIRHLFPNRWVFWARTHLAKCGIVCSMLRPLTRGENMLTEK